MLCEWERARGERPPPNLARIPQGVRAFFFVTIIESHFSLAARRPGLGPEPTYPSQGRHADLSGHQVGPVCDRPWGRIYEPVRSETGPTTDAKTSPR